jgi:hypothetical protein
MIINLPIAAKWIISAFATYLGGPRIKNPAQKSAMLTEVRDFPQSL